MGVEYELKYRANADCLESVFTTFPARWQSQPPGPRLKTDRETA